MALTTLGGRRGSLWGRRAWRAGSPVQTPRAPLPSGAACARDASIGSAHRGRDCRLLVSVNRDQMEREARPRCAADRANCALTSRQDLILEFLQRGARAVVPEASCSALLVVCSMC